MNQIILPTTLHLLQLVYYIEWHVHLVIKGAVNLLRLLLPGNIGRVILGNGRRVFGELFFDRKSKPFVLVLQTVVFLFQLQNLLFYLFELSPEDWDLVLHLLVVVLEFQVEVRGVGLLDRSHRVEWQVRFLIYAIVVNRQVQVFLFQVGWESWAVTVGGHPFLAHRLGRFWPEMTHELDVLRVQEIALVQNFFELLLQKFVLFDRVGYLLLPKIWVDL